jgi:hypothetical protein
MLLLAVHSYSQAASKIKAFGSQTRLKAHSNQRRKLMLPCPDSLLRRTNGFRTALDALRGDFRFAGLHHIRI